METSERRLHVVAVGAHPDDVTFGVGGIIASYVKRGHRATILNVSQGETVWPPEKADEAFRIRKKEGEDIARILGADVVCLDRPNNHCIPSWEQKDLLVDELRKLQPNILLFTTPWDTHADHRNLANTMIDVVYYVGHKGMAFGHPPCDLLSAWMYLTEVSTQAIPPPDLLFDISDTWQSKRESLTGTRPIFGQEGEDQAIHQLETVARFFGMRSGVRYAEPLWQTWGSMKMARLTRDWYRVSELPLMRR